MAKIQISFEKVKNGIMVNMVCINKEDYLDLNIIPPDTGINMKRVLYSKVSFTVTDIKTAKKIIAEKKEAISNYLNDWRNLNQTLPSQNTYTL